MPDSKNKCEKLGFRTKAAALRHFRAMLHHSIPLDQRLLGELLALHPRAAEKVGPGVEHFYVAGAAYGSRCFYVKRTDGTRTDFSYLKCLAAPKAAIL